MLSPHAYPFVIIGKGLKRKVTISKYDLLLGIKMGFELIRKETVGTCDGHVHI